MMVAILYTIFLVLLAAAAASDLRARLISNHYPAAIALLFLPLAVVGGIAAWPAHLAVFAGVFVVCLGLFAAGLLGGGDAKLIPAVALWAGPGALAAFLLVTAVAGGAIALAMMTARRLRPAGGGAGEGAESQAAAPGPQDGVPYGLAIALGGLIVATEPLLNAFSPYFDVVSGNGV